MVQVNENYLKLKAGYLFPEIAKRVNLHYQKSNSSDLINLGIGDVTEPLPKVCIQAMNKALDEMGTNEGFRGYGPEQGYIWLREKIAVNDFNQRGCQILPEEIFSNKSSEPTISAPDSSDSLALSPFANTATRKSLPIPLGRLITPRTF